MEATELLVNSTLNPGNQVGILLWYEYIIYTSVCTFLVLFGGLMSGLTLGLLSIDPMQLSVLKSAGSESEKRAAKKIEPILKNHHLLLVTLLLMNALAMESLPLFLDKMVPEWVAIGISVTMVLLFGEIIPQAVCQRYGLYIGAYLNWFVIILMAISLPVAWPIAKLLDFLLGHENHMFNRYKLKEFVSIHSEDENHDGTLNLNEVKVIKGVLEMEDKQVNMAFTPLENVFSLEINTPLDKETFQKIKETSLSRIPVYENEISNFKGYIIVKRLIGMNPDGKLLLKDMEIFPFFNVVETDPLWSTLNKFLMNRHHLALVENESSQIIGLISIEDILEELLKREIVDETDIFVDMQKRIKVEHIIEKDDHIRENESI